jgi:hypothetical protein
VPSDSVHALMNCMRLRVIHLSCYFGSLDYISAQSKTPYCKEDILYIARCLYSYAVVMFLCYLSALITGA